MATAVRDRLKVVPENLVRQLRLDPEIFTTLTAIANEGDTVFTVDDVEGAKVGEAIFLDGVAYIIKKIDRVNKTLTIDKPLSTNYPVDFVLEWHQDYHLLLIYFEAAKENIDNFLKGQTFEGEAIPVAIETMALRYTAYYYQSNVLGIGRISEKGLGGTTYTEPDLKEIFRHKNITGY